VTTAGAIATGLHRRPQTNIMRGQISPMGPQMRAYLILPLTLLFLCGPLHAEWVSDDREIMGTSVRVELWFDDVQAGAGIVADSDPASEHQECVNKAKALLVAVDKAEHGLM